MKQQHSWKCFKNIPDALLAQLVLCPFCVSKKNEKGHQRLMGTAHPLDALI
jgi:hypothetical protein